jgi:hypothetical protein
MTTAKGAKNAKPKARVSTKVQARPVKPAKASHSKTVRPALGRSRATSKRTKPGAGRDSDSRRGNKTSVTQRRQPAVAAGAKAESKSKQVVKAKAPKAVNMGRLRKASQKSALVAADEEAVRDSIQTLPVLTLTDESFAKDMAEQDAKDASLKQNIFKIAGAATFVAVLAIATGDWKICLVFALGVICGALAWGGGKDA